MTTLKCICGQPMTAWQVVNFCTLKELEARQHMHGKVTRKQVRKIIMYMEPIFAETRDRHVERTLRLALLGWVFGRHFESTNDLARAEAAALLTWLSATPLDVRMVECQRCIEAHYEIEGVS